MVDLDTMLNFLFSVIGFILTVWTIATVIPQYEKDAANAERKPSADGH